MVVSTNPNLQDILDYQFLSNCLNYLVGSKHDKRTVSFEELVQHLQDEFKDNQAVIDWIGSTELDPGILENVKSQLGTPLGQVPMKDLTTLVQQVYKLLCLMIVTSVRGRNAAWSLTNLHYMEGEDMRSVLQRFTPYDTGSGLVGSGLSAASAASEAAIGGGNPIEASLIAQNERLCNQLVAEQSTVNDLEQKVLEQSELITQLQEEVAKSSEKFSMTPDDGRAQFETRILEGTLVELLDKFKRGC